MAKNEKILDEHGIRLLIRLISGIKSNSDLALSKCIDLYDSTKVYNKNDICVFDNKLWLANTVVTNTEPSFTDTAHWISLDDEFNEIGEQDIEDLMQSVSESTWDYLKNILSDQISTTHAWNSSTSYAQDQATLQSAKDYTDQQVSKSLSKSYVVVNDLSLVQEDKYIYLVEQGDGSYLSYVLGKDGNPISFGDPNNVNLEGYAKTEDIANEYAKSSDLDSKFATITTTDGLRTDLDNHKNDTVAHLTQAERDKLVTTDVLGDYAKTVDLPTPRTDDEIKTLADGQIESKMTTTINSDSTDTEIPSAKSVYDISGFNIFTEEDAKSFGNSTFLSGFVNKTIASTVIPDATDHYNLIKLPWNGNYNTQIWITASGKKKAYIQYAKTNGVWDTPKMICTTKVSDVAKTSITFSDETNYSVVNNSCLYFVKNGMCTMMLYIQCNTPSASWVTVANVPKADTLNYYQHLTNGGGDKFMECLIKTDGVLQFHGGAAGTSYLATFSYPVAES